MSKEAPQPGIRPQWRISRSTLDALLFYAAPEISLRGEENLQLVRELKEQGQPIIFMGNHLSNADAPVVHDALNSKGYPDIAGSLVFLLGKRLTQERFPAFLTHAIPTIPVWPRTLVPQNEAESREAGAMNLLAGRAVRTLLKEGERAIFVFPEGTRSRQQTLQQPVYDVGRYVTAVEGTVVVPVGLWGTEQMLAIGQVMPNRGQKVFVNVGKPIEVSGIRPDKKGSREQKDGQLKAMMDYIMGEIAGLLPPNYRGVYQ